MHRTSSLCFNHKSGLGQLVWDEVVDEHVAPRLVEGCVDVLLGLEVVFLGVFWLPVLVFCDCFLDHFGLTFFNEVGGALVEPQSSVQEGVPAQLGVASGLSQLREEDDDHAGVVLA